MHMKVTTRDLNKHLQHLHKLYTYFCDNNEQKEVKQWKKLKLNFTILQTRKKGELRTKKEHPLH